MSRVGWESGRSEKEASVVLVYGSCKMKKETFDKYDHRTLLRDPTLEI